MLLGTLGVSLSGNLLADKDTIRTGEETIRAGEGRIFSWPGFLMQSHPLTNFEIKNYCQNEPKFNGVYSGNNLPKRKDRTYVINLD